MRSLLKLLVIIPARNEEKTIKRIVNQTKLCNPSCDVVVIIDISTDKTEEYASKAGARVLKLPINIGIGGAVQTGFKYALERDYDIAIQVDADGQHDPSQIPELIKPIKEESADVVIGSRYIKSQGYKTPIARRIGMNIFSKITSIICHQRITDITSGFRAINRRTIKFLVREYPINFPDAEVLILLHRAGFVIKEIPVTMNRRAFGNSYIDLLKSIYYPFRSLMGILAVLIRKNKRRG